MPSINRTEQAKKYKGKWVALKADRKTVVASGTTAKSAQRAAEKKGCTKPVITRFPKTPRRFVGAHL